MKKQICLITFILVLNFTKSFAQIGDALFDVKWDFETWTFSQGNIPEYYSLSGKTYNQFGSVETVTCLQPLLVQSTNKYAGASASSLQPNTSDQSCNGGNGGGYFSANLDASDTAFYVSGYYEPHLAVGDTAVLAVFYPSSNYLQYNYISSANDAYNSASMIITAADNSADYKFFSIKYRHNQAAFQPSTDISVNFQYRFEDYVHQGSASYVLFDDVVATKNSPSGINEAANTIPGFNVFPNLMQPGDMLNVKVSIAGMYNLSLYDVLGRQVENQLVKLPTTVDISSSSFPQGIYFCKVEGQGGVSTTKIVVQ